MLLRHESEDLMQKYYNQESVVLEIIKGKDSGGIPFFWTMKVAVNIILGFVDCIAMFVQEEVGDWQYNPDVPTMKLYKCWDSSAAISKNDTSRSVNITREGELSGKDARDLM